MPKHSMLLNQKCALSLANLLQTLNAFLTLMHFMSTNKYAVAPTEILAQSSITFCHLSAFCHKYTNMSNITSNSTQPSWYAVGRLASGVPVSSALLVLVTILFVLLVILRNSPVIKSRGVVTYLALLVHAICGIVTIISSNDVPTEASCFMVLSFVFPIYLTLLIMYLIQYLRFVLLRKGQNMKQEFAEHHSTSQVRIKLVQVLSKPWLVVPCVLLVYALWHVVMWPMILAGKNRETGIIGIYNDASRCNSAFVPMIIVFTVTLLVIAVVTSGLFVGVSAPLFCQYGGLREVLFEQDAFLFQLELIALFCSNILFILIDFAFFFAVPFSSVFFATVNTFLLNILNSLLCPGFAIILALRYEYQRRKIKSNLTMSPNTRNSLAKFNASIDVLSLIFQNDTSRLLFRNFSKAEFSIENFLCYEEVLKFKTLQNDEQRLACAMSIYDSFLKLGSVLEVNTTQLIRDEVAQSLQSHQAPPSLFHKVQDSVASNLLDVYSRFYHCKAFQDYVATELTVKP